MKIAARTVKENLINLNLEAVIECTVSPMRESQTSCLVIGTDDQYRVTMGQIRKKTCPKLANLTVRALREDRQVVQRVLPGNPSQLAIKTRVADVNDFVSEALKPRITSCDGGFGLAYVVSCARFFVARVQFSLHPRKNPCGKSP